MHLIKIAAAVLNQTALDWGSNKRNIIGAIEEARANEVSILCLPELCIPGYGCEDAFLSAGTHAMSLTVLGEILPHTQDMVVSLGLPLRYRNGLFNAAALAVDGRLAGFVAKRFLAGDGLHYEPRWFKPWPIGVRGDLQLDSESYPVGDIHFDCGGIKVGFEICEDAWVSNRPGIRLAERAVDIILNPSASHFAFGKCDIRRRFVVEGSRAFGASYVYSNLVGNASGRSIFDGGALIASGGELLASGKRFSFAPFSITSAVVDVGMTRMKQARLSSFVPDFSSALDDCVRVPMAYPDVPPSAVAASQAGWEGDAHGKEEEFARAVPLALFDYLRKTRSHGFVVSLSGGADSAAVACLCALAVELACAELGLQRLKERLDHIPWLAQQPSTGAIISQLLTCVYQATRNSSKVTEAAARSVAEELGTELLVLDVDAIVTAYSDIVSSALQRQLGWETDDLALQNIQARARAPGVWMIANIKNALLLATSNRSEAAVGYATMDGDTCGGVSPIAGIDKAFLRHWLKWLQETGPKGGRPLPGLAAVTAQAPTAELRPPEQEQTDEGDLMPYDVLDVIERCAIRDKLTPAEVYERVCATFPERQASHIATWVERFFVLWCRNQWKRERYAPSFHVDDENLDPKTWCRFPILSGGYSRELAALRLKTGR